MPGCWAQGEPYPDFRTAVQGRLQGEGDVQAKTHGRSRIGPCGEMAGPVEGVQRPRADRRRGQGKSRCQTSKGIVSQAKESGLSPGTTGYLQLVSRGEWCLRKVTLPVVRSEIGEGAPGADTCPGMMELKRGWIHWVVQTRRGLKEDSWGSWGGGIRKAEPLPITVSRRGARLSPLHQYSFHSPGPASSPWKHSLGKETRGEAPVDLSPRCSPAPPAPHPVICFHQERRPSVSASSQLRAGRAGHPGRRSCLSSPTNDLGPGWERAWPEFKQPRPPPQPLPPAALGSLSPLPPATSPRVILHLGPFQSKLDSWELQPLRGLRLPLDSLSLTQEALPCPGSSGQD